MDGVFETFEYSKFQDVNETIAATWLSIFIVEMHMKKQHQAQFGISILLQCSVVDGLQTACLQACRAGADVWYGGKSVVFLY